MAARILAAEALGQIANGVSVHQSNGIGQRGGRGVAIIDLGRRHGAQHKLAWIDGQRAIDKVQTIAGGIDHRPEGCIDGVFANIGGRNAAAGCETRSARHNVLKEYITKAGRIDQAMHRKRQVRIEQRVAVGFLGTASSQCKRGRQLENILIARPCCRWGQACGALVPYRQTAACQIAKRIKVGILGINQPVATAAGGDRLRTCQIDKAIACLKRQIAAAGNCRSSGKVDGAKGREYRALAEAVAALDGDPGRSGQVELAGGGQRVHRRCVGVRDCHRACVARQRGKAIVSVGQRVGATGPLERQLRGGQRTGLRCRAVGIELERTAICLDGAVQRNTARSRIQGHIECARRRTDRLIYDNAVDRVELERGAGTRSFSDRGTHRDVASFRALGDRARCNLNVGACVEQAGNLRHIDPRCGTAGCPGLAEAGRNETAVRAARTRMHNKTEL